MNTLYSRNIYIIYLIEIYVYRSKDRNQNVNSSILCVLEFWVIFILFLLSAFIILLQWDHVNFWYSKNSNTKNLRFTLKECEKTQRTEHLLFPNTTKLELFPALSFTRFDTSWSLLTTVTGFQWLFFLTMLWAMQDLTSPTRDWTQTPCIGNTEF